MSEFERLSKDDVLRLAQRMFSMVQTQITGSKLKTLESRAGKQMLMADDVATWSKIKDTFEIDRTNILHEGVLASDVMRRLQ